MNKRADFYILSTNEPSKRLNFACQLIEKSYNAGLHLFVLTENNEQAKTLDAQLWTFKPTSFIPHTTDQTTQQSPVVLGITLNNDKKFTAILNLTDQLLESHDSFHRIFEIIPDEPTAQVKARERYKNYRAAGFELNTHKIGNAP